MIIVLFQKIVKKIQNSKITSDLLQITSDFSKRNFDNFFFSTSIFLMDSKITSDFSKITSDITSDFQKSMIIVDFF